MPPKILICVCMKCVCADVTGPQTVGQCSIPISEAPQLMGEGPGTEAALCGGEEYVVEMCAPLWELFWTCIT